MMPPLPIDGHQTPLPAGMASVPTQSGGSISLSVIVDFILQRTYHELTVLAELLPRKTDMERKIEIVQFANRTRQLFVRLLALVKWAGSASKVDKCASIMGFLDKQSMLFIETADMLSRMARETLVHARLPNFQLPCAVEVLTMGSYVRLPTCIKDRILTHDPITPQDKQATLLRLEQIIQHRLVTSVDLPPQMRDLRIENGRVTFHVNQEFEVSLTLMGDTPNIPWRLLDIVFLVEDKETGDGRSLVHALQCRYIIDLVQSRLLDNPSPLYDLYNCLHSFCQSLQLEVLYSQVHRLCQERLGDYVRVVEYIPGKCLSVVFWRELTEKTGVDYKLCIQINPQDNCRPLQLIHSPPLNGSEAQQADQAVKSDLLSFERLLVQTIYVRTKLRLHELKEEIKDLLQWNLECTVNGSPAVLNVPILQPCLRSEQLLITLDTHLGIYLAHVPQYADAPFVDEIKQSLNGNRNQFKTLISNLKFWIVLQRCRKSIQHLPAVAMEKLPLLHPPEHPISRLSRHKLYIKLCKHPNSYLIVELFVKEDNPLEIEENFHLLILEPSTYKESGGNTIAAGAATPVRSAGPASVGPSETETAVMTPGSNAPPSTPSSSSNPGTQSTDGDAGDKQIPKLFYTIKSLIQFETFAVTHGSYTKVDAGDTMEICRNYPLGKRKLGATSTTVSCKSGGDIQGSGTGGSSAKRPKHPAYFLPNLAHVVAMTDERIPFAALAEQLTQRGLCHQGLQVEAGGAGLALRLVQMPPCKGLDSSVSQALQRVLLGCTIRMQGRGSRTWWVKYSFCKCPIFSNAPKEQGPRRPVYFMYDVSPANGASKTVDDLISDWNAIAYLYGAVLEYADCLNKDTQGILNGMAEVKSFSYKRLILGYGPNKANTVAIYWRSNDNRFSLSFGIIGQTSSAVNPHTLTAAQLQHNFNRHRSIPTLLKLLCDTYHPLLSISKLSTAPMYAITFNRPQQPLPTFTVIPRSPTHLLISFRNVYCIDVHCRGEGTVAVKDGAYSLFDKSKVVDGFVPTPGLKAFLNKFVDDSGLLLRRRSQSEDDNPPSPVTSVDTLDSFMTGHPKPGSPAQRSQEVTGLRFHHPPTPSSTSNPHTPASPHPSVLPYGSSPVAQSSFSLASPPSLHSINPSPSTVGLHMGTPSPGSLLATNSPGNPLHAPSPGSFMPQPSPSGPPVHMSPVSAYVGGSSSDGGAPSGGTPGGSGLPIASPAPQWPGSPSMPRPSPAGGRGFGNAQSPGHPALHSPQNIGEHSKAQGGGGASYLRVLPQRLWAAAVPTLLSEQAFDNLCSPAPLPGHPVSGPHMVHCCPLQRFLGCVYMRKHLQRCILAEEYLTNVPCTEAGVIQFKVETLQCRVTLNHNNFQTVHLKLTPTPDYQDQWMADEIQCLESFFVTKVVCNPYKPNAIVAFARILNAPIQILKDCIQIMIMELCVDRNSKWTVQWCLTIPPAAPPIAPSGMAAVVIARNKLLFFIQLTRNPMNFPHQTELPTLVLPIVYDMIKNTTELADRQQVQLSPTSPTVIVSGMLKRFAERRPNLGECSIFPAIRELMTNLEINM